MVLVSISVRSKLVLCTDDILELFLLKEGANVSHRVVSQHVEVTQAGTYRNVAFL